MKILLSLFFIPLLLQAYSYPYTGEFKSVSSNGTVCDGIFSSVKFRTQHFLSGPTNLTSVVYLKSADNTGLFDGISLVGNNDGWGRLRVERDVLQAGITYRVVADGLYDPQFLLLDFTVEAFSDPKSPAICKATSQFSAYR